MTNHIETSDQDTPRTAVANRFRRRRPQFGLLTLLLLASAFTVWVAYFNNRSAIPDLRARLDGIRPFIRELYVDDTSQIAVVKLEERWIGDNRWQVYLPSASNYRLCLATREVPDSPLIFVKAKNGVAQIANPPYFPAKFESHDLASGIHTFELESEVVGAKLNGLVGGEWKTSIREEGGIVLEIEEPRSWGQAAVASPDGHLAESRQYAPDQPVTLHRSRYLRTTGRFDWTGGTDLPGPSDGILLWIEKVKD